MKPYGRSMERGVAGQQAARVQTTRFCDNSLCGLGDLDIESPEFGGAKPRKRQTLLVYRDVRSLLFKRIRHSRWPLVAVGAHIKSASTPDSMAELDPHLSFVRHCRPPEAPIH